MAVDRSRRRVLRHAAAVGGAAACIGCLGRQPPALTDLDRWPPEHDDEALSFWTWQEYWGNQARAFKHLAELDSIEQGNVPANEQFDRLRNGAQVDVLHVPSRSFGRMLDDDLLQPLPVDEMPNWQGTDDWYYQDAINVRLDGEVYGVPQTPMMHALVYHSGVIDEPDSWALLWDDDLEGRIAMPADPILNCQIGALYTGQDPNDPNDFEAIEDALSQQRPLVDAYEEDWMETWRRIGKDELAAAVIPSARMCLCSQDGTPVRRVAPREGVLYGYSTLAVSRTTTNPWAAIEFINWAIDFKVASTLLWNPEEWTLYPAQPVGESIRREYERIAGEVGVDAD